METTTPRPPLPSPPVPADTHKERKRERESLLTIISRDNLPYDASQIQCGLSGGYDDFTMYRYVFFFFFF